MEENELSEQYNSKKTKQPISVPFLWEEKPGTPKRDWKHTPQQIQVSKPPVKLEASVPFKWEEKPGKPLPGFLEPQSESAIQLTSTKLALPRSPAISQHYNEDDDDDDDDEQGRISETDHEEACSSETDDSFCSVPSLSANQLVPSVAICGSVPVEPTTLTDDHSGHLQAPSSPTSETDGSTSSYATGTTSLVGAPFLECLFPLLQPDSSFLEKVGRPESSSRAPPKVPSVDFDSVSNRSVIIRRPPTLGELIMMSRRRSYQRKADRTWQEFMKKTAFGCCTFGTGDRVQRLHRTWKRQLQLKLM